MWRSTIATLYLAPHSNLTADLPRMNKPFEGGLFAEPAAHSKPGHTFDGWYETTPGVCWDFASDTVTGNMAPTPENMPLVL